METQFDRDNREPLRLAANERFCTFLRAVRNTDTYAQGRGQLTDFDYVAEEYGIARQYQAWRVIERVTLNGAYIQHPECYGTKQAAWDAALIKSGHGAASPIDLLDAAKSHVRTMAACAARDRALELLSIAMGEVLADLPENERYA